MPGHDLHALLVTLGRALALPGPTIVHVRTQKGRGYRPAETDQVGFHGAALPPIAMAPATDAYDGSRAPMPTESMADDAAPPPRSPTAPTKNPNYTAVFAAELIELARTDRRIVGITAGMPTGTGMAKFQAEFPDRFFDVGIAEQHSVALATGLAMGGMRPVVALYSTFLQRAFDQTVHDVCQNDQPVLSRSTGPGWSERTARMDMLVDSLLAYRANAPVIDQLLTEAGFLNKGGPVSSLLSGATGAAAAPEGHPAPQE